MLFKGNGTIMPLAITASMYKIINKLVDVDIKNTPIAAAQYPNTPILATDEPKPPSK